MSSDGDRRRSATAHPNGTLGFIGEGLVELTLDRHNGPASLSYGGDAANIAAMAARLGADVRLAGRVGDDVLGQRLLDFWRRNNIDVTHIRCDDQAPTGLYVNELRPGVGHHFTYLRTGSAGSRWCLEDLDERLLSGASVLGITGVTLAVSSSVAQAALRAVELARAQSVDIACVLNHRAALKPDVHALAAFASESDIVFASAEDATAIYGIDSIDDLREHLSAPREVVLTQGDGDAVVFYSGSQAQQPVPPVPVRNAAGAGDALAGAYLAARYEHRLAPDRALAWGVAAASLSVQQHGCGSSYPTLAETRSQLLTLPAPPTSARPT